ERAAHLHRPRPVRVGEYRVFQADGFERAKDIGPKLDAGAELHELGCLLEHAHRKAPAGERIGGREPADAAPPAPDCPTLAVLLRHRSLAAASGRPPKGRSLDLVSPVGIEPTTY